MLRLYWGYNSWFEAGYMQIKVFARLIAHGFNFSLWQTDNFGKQESSLHSEDGACYGIDEPEELVIYCINRAKKLLVDGAERRNKADFLAEISSYWTRAYNGEPSVDESYVIYDRLPTSTELLNAVHYNTPIAGLPYSKTIGNTIIFDSEESSICQYISNKFPVKNSTILYIGSFQVSDEAPYSLTFSSFMDRIAEKEDRKKVRQYINKNNGGRVFFRLTDNSLGGIKVSSVELNRNGFRHGNITSCDVHLKYEKKNILLSRLYASLYSKQRVAERTAGTLMQEQKFAIAGLGSVGSNLVHFLNGNNNVSYSLIDTECLTMDNIGRHLLGFGYINQSKVHAIADHLHSIRPEQNIDTHICTIQNYLSNNIEDLNQHNALFVCIGDTMSEEYIIKAINDKLITIPVFFLWLEPFGIAAHMVYINNLWSHEPIQIIDSDTLLYKYNVISSVEYNHSASKFSKNDAGCNGSYSLYSGNDVLKMLSAFYPVIDKLLSNPENSIIYRWIGNIEEAENRNIECSINLRELQKGIIQELPL